jgi:sec-independent protein translocase protein TatB
VFGLSFGEMIMVLGVAMVVLGPKELPRYLRRAGQFAGRLRRLAADMREKSGIDEVLRTEGIDRDIAEIRKLTRGELAGIVTSVRSVPNAVRFANPPATPYAPPPAPPPAQLAAPISREREYPVGGADSYGALPDTAPVYDGAIAAAPIPSAPAPSAIAEPEGAAPPAGASEVAS